MHVQMDHFRGNLAALEGACEEALSGLQQCLGGVAVHGDLRILNILVRCVRGWAERWQCISGLGCTAAVEGG